MDRFLELKALAAIDDAGSFTKAARKLNYSTATVSRQIAMLEHRFGIVLVERGKHRCRLTDEGRSLVTHARTIIEIYEQAARDAAGLSLQPQGRIKIAAPPILGRDYLMPMVTGFVDRFEAIAASVHLDDRTLDLEEHEIDVAVRVGSPGGEGLIAKRIGFARPVTVAAPAYLTKFGNPGTPPELARHRVILRQTTPRRESLMFRNPTTGRAALTRVSSRISVNSADAARVAAISGAGISRTYHYAVASDLKAGRLVPILERFEPDPLPVWLVWLERTTQFKKVRLLIDHLTQGFAGVQELRARGKG